MSENGDYKDTELNWLPQLYHLGTSICFKITRNQIWHGLVTGGNVCIVWMEVLVLGFPVEDLCEDLCSRTARRKGAITKQFIKDFTISRWENRQAQTRYLCWGYKGPFIFCVLGPWIIDSVVSNWACFCSLEDSSHRLARGVFYPTRLYQSWQPSPWGREL